MFNKTVIDLFAGVGGMSLGFEQAGFSIVCANEFDRAIATSYIRNRADAHMIIGDIRELNIKETFRIFRHNVGVVIGGPPCQGYSQKGKRKTIHDERNFLFRNFVEVIGVVNPNYFVMENVPNLFTAEGGYFKQEICELFASMGYSLNMKILNASDFGIPQHRRRAYIIGFRGKHFVPMPEQDCTKVTIWDAISDLAFLESGEGCESAEYRFEPQTSYQRIMRNGQNVLFNHKATNHSKSALKRLSMIPQEKGRECLPKEFLTKSIYSGTWSRMKKGGQSVTITTRFDTPSSGEFTHPILNRAITVREAARLQSFPDTFVFYGSKTSQMKQVGNAVPPRLAKRIAMAILKDAEQYC